MFRSKQSLALGVFLSILAIVCFQNCGGFKAASYRLSDSSSFSSSATDLTLKTACGTNYSPGHASLRRLTNTEYTNTVQDLLFSKQNPGKDFQPNSPGKSGFSNDSETLVIYSTTISSYYQAAISLAKEVIQSKGKSGGAYSKLVTCSTSQASCATSTVTNLAKRAFRRPPTGAELDQNTGLMGVFSPTGTFSSTNFDQGLYDVIVSILLNPNFLTIPIVSSQSQNPNATFALDDYQLATRLSYVLWQSMPDSELMSLADAGTLSSADVLSAQIQRMFSDPRIMNLKNTLRDDYAGIASLAQIDFATFNTSGITNTLRDSMIGETDAFFTDLITQNRSPLTILNGSQSFVNKTLADYYGLNFPAGTNQLSFVPVQSGRIGLGSQASILTNTSGGDPTFTNPIKRGHWIADALLCSPPPPPPVTPPNLPPTSATLSTIRDKLAVHESNPACAGCHVSMDNYGLGAENFDPFGKWRLNYLDHSKVDSSGKFPNGVAFASTNEMYSDLTAQAKALSCVPQHFMNYALSRNMASTDDQCVAKALGQLNMNSTSSLSDLFTNIVLSNQFLQQTGEAP